MKTFLAILTLSLLAGAARAQDAVDSIKTESGLVPGVISEMTKDQITVKQTAGDKTIAVNEIQFIRFSGEPKELHDARLAIERGALEDAAAALAKVNPAEISRDVVKQEFQFYAAYVKARMALDGKGKLGDAYSQMITFISTGGDNFHYYAANEAAGDLAAAAGAYDKAEKSYSEVAKASWPDYQMRANVSRGRVLMSQKKSDEALDLFDKVMKMPAPNKGAEAVKFVAAAGKADALAETGKPEEAIKLANTVVDKAPADAPEAYARAYNALGKSYRKLNQPKEAHLAYLHVPNLFSSQGECNAEALSNLKVLWKEVYQDEKRAAEAANELSSRYPNSRWAKQ